MHGQVCGWATCLLFLCGCFRDASALPASEPPPEVTQWSVRDARDVPWQSDQAPRSPRFVVRFDRALPARLSSAPPLYLVRGVVDEELSEDLADPPHRKQTVTRLMTLEVEAMSAHVLHAQSPEPLEPGLTYTLVWALPGATQVLPLQVSRSPTAGARLVESWPGHGALEVAPNLSRILLRFDGYLEAAPTAALREEDEGAGERPLATSLERCGARGLPEGDCLWIEVDGLAPRAAYRVRLMEETQDATGNPLAIPDLRFRTGEREDTTAPALANLSCALDEQPWEAACLLLGEERVTLRARTDEPTLMELIAWPQRSGAVSFSEPVSLSVGELLPSPCVFLRLTDLANNQRQVPLCVTLPTDLPTLSIDEVHVDPLGPEPAQEYVELLNFGDKAVSMHGFTLTSDPFSEGFALAEASPVQPGERVLLVSAQFERHDPSEAQVPSAIRLVRLSRPLSLRNDGVELFLRDTHKRRISASPRIAPEQPGQCLGRVGDDLRSAHPDHFLLDPSGGCTPGSETRLASAPP